MMTNDLNCAKLLKHCKPNSYGDIIAAWLITKGKVKFAMIYGQRAAKFVIFIKYDIFSRKITKTFRDYNGPSSKTSREYKNAQAKAWYEKCKLENPEKWEQLRFRHNARETERRKRLKKMKE